MLSFPGIARAQLQGSDLTQIGPVVVTGSGTGAGVVRVFSATTGAQVVAAPPFGPAFTGGVRVALGDVNADGVVDVVLGAGVGGGDVRVYSGADYSLLRSIAPFGSFGGGVYVATGDIDADGHADIITGGGNGSGLVRIYSGADGHEIIGGAPFPAPYAGGVTVAAGDVTGDGRADVIVGTATGGLVEIFDLATVSIVAAAFPYGPLHLGGVNVAAGDLDGDGRDDVVVAPRSGGGLVHMFSLATSTLLGSLVPFPASSGVNIAAGDVDGDGAAELVVAPGSGGEPRVRVFSYMQGRDILTFLAEDPAFAGGVFAAASQAVGTVRFTSPSADTFRVGVAREFTVRSTGGATVTLSLAGASPAGVTFTDNGNGTGNLSGTAQSGTEGIYALQFIARRGGVEVGRQNFTLSVHSPIAITSANSANWTQNQPNTFTVTTIGFPRPTLSTTGGWPIGVTFVDQGDGTARLSGTPPAVGTFTSTITAANSAGDIATQTFTLTVNSGILATTITSAPSTSFTVGAPGTFTVTTSGNPVAATISLTGVLPAGVTFINNGDGTAALAGTPAVGTTGSYPLVITATNGIGSPATQNLTLVVGDSSTPLFTSASAATFTVGASDSFLVTTSGAPAATITVSGVLPTGVTFTNHGNGTATFAGMPAAGTAGTYALTVEASNGAGIATQNFTLAVNPLAGGLPTITSADGIVFVVGNAAQFTVTTTGTPTVTTLTATGGLPTGVTFTANGDGTGILAGTPAGGSAGVYPLVISADNGLGTATQNFTLAINNVSSTPIFTSAASTTFTVGTAATFAVTTGATPAVTAITLSGTLPAGLTFVDNGDGTAAIAGMAQPGTAGAYGLALTATNGAGSPVNQAFVLKVHQQASFTSGNAVTFLEEQLGTFTVTTLGTPIAALTIGGTLPAGINFVDNGDRTATLAGTPADGSAGAYPFTITAVNGVGAAADVAFTLTIAHVNKAPTFTIGPNQTQAEDSGAQVVPSWATDISAGPNEPTQTVAFEIVGNSNPSLFQVAPAVSSTGELSYTPAPNANGVATISVRITDDGGTANGGVNVSPAQDFTITITAVNDAPVADADAYNLAEAGTINEAAPGVLVGDTDIEGSTLAAVLVAGPSHASAFTLNPDGSFTYTHDGSENALDSFTYRANDGSLDSNIATVTITINVLNDPPVVANETFELLGNTELRVDMAAGSTPHTSETTSGVSPVEGVLDNDTDPEGDPFSVTAIIGCSDLSAPFDCTLPDGAVIHVDANGEFSYTPAPGATTGSFTYTVTDTPSQGIAASANGTVTFTFFDMIWYVDGDVPAGGDGTSHLPFNDFGSLNGAGGSGDSDGAGDYIFVHDSTVNSGIELEASQHLVGEGVGLSITRNLNGNGTPTVLVAPGTAPLINNASGNAVDVTTAMASEIAGFSLAGVANAVDVTTGGPLTGSATLTIANNEIASAGQEGIDVTLGPGTAGTLVLNLQTNSWNTANSHLGHAVDIVRNNGTLILDVSGNVNIKSNIRGVLVDGGNPANTYITGFANNSVHPSTLGHAVTITGATFDANVATGGIQQVNGGTLTVGLSGNPVPTRGVQILGVEGSLYFTDLDVFAGETGLSVTGSGSGFALAVTPVSSGGSSTIVALNGAAATASGVALDLQLSGLTSTTGGSGVTLTSVTGQFSAGAGSAITKSSGAGAAFAVSDSSAAVNYAGSLNVSSGSGVVLSNNAGPVNFTGQLTLTTGVNPAFSATGASGTVTATNSANTLATTTGTALTVSGPDIGAGGLVFRSIASNGAASGIVLQDTGTTAGLTVTGTGSTGTGGTVAASTGPGISLTNTGTISLSHMNVQGGTDDGIRGAGVNGFNLTNVNITSNGDALGERGIDMTELTGTGTMLNVAVSGSAEDNVRIANTAGTLSALNVTNSSFATTNMTTGSHGLLVEQNGTGAMTLSITGSTFTDNKGDHFRVSSQASASGSIHFTFSNNTLTTTAGNDPNVIGGGITISPSGSTDVTFTINANSIQEAFDEAINLNLGTASTALASMVGTISNNTIGSAGTPDSGSESGSGISVASNGAGLTTVAITGNQVFQYANPYGIFVTTRDGNSALNATITGNTVSNPGTLALNGIHLQAGATTGDSGVMCAAVTGNSAANAGLLTDDIRLRQLFSTTIRLPGYGGGNSDTAAVNAFVQANNGGAGTDVSSTHNVGGGGGGFVGGAACPVP